MAETQQRLAYPESVNSTGLYLNFIPYDYSKAPTAGSIPDIRDLISGSSGRNSVGNLINIKSELAKGDAQNTSLGYSVALYLPPKVEYNYGAEWQKVSFGALGSSFDSTGGVSFADVAKNIGATAGNYFAQQLTNLSGFDAIPKTSDINLDTVIGAAFGQTFNDNTLQTFNRMNTRTFGFDYLMVARNAKEEDTIRLIIRTFKLGMHPGSKYTNRSNSLFLTYPYIWKILPSGYKGKLKVKSGGKVTDVSSANPSISSFLPQTKYCALTNMNVDYTPDNVIALTQGGFVQAVRLSLQFTEISTLTRQDIESYEEPYLQQDRNKFGPAF